MIAPHSAAVGAAARTRAALPHAATKRTTQISRQHISSVFHARRPTRARAAGADGEGDADEAAQAEKDVADGTKTWAEAYPQTAKKDAPLPKQIKVTDQVPSELLANMAGGTSPMGKSWDPVSLTAGVDALTLARYRESELAHCRVCMLASLGILVGENFPFVNDIFSGGIEGPAINQFQQIQRPFWELIVFAIGLAETTRAQIGWMPPNESLFQLRPEYDPGDLGWDPLGLRPDKPDELRTMRDKELNNGRLAMIGTAGMVIQELVDEKPILPIHGGFFG